MTLVLGIAFYTTNSTGGNWVRSWVYVDRLMGLHWERWGPNWWCFLLEILSLPWPKTAFAACKELTVLSCNFPFKCCKAYVIKCALTLCIPSSATDSWKELGISHLGIISLNKCIFGEVIKRTWWFKLAVWEHETFCHFYCKEYEHLSQPFYWLDVQVHHVNCTIISGVFNPLFNLTKDVTCFFWIHTGCSVHLRGFFE